MKLKQLQQELQQVAFISKPKIELEQYPTSAHLAAQMIYTVDSQFGDIEDRVVIDLGCGGAILGIAAGMLGAGQVIGIDIDTESLEIAANNIEEMEVDMDLMNADVELLWRTVRMPFADTVVMNPPFGTRKKGIDMIFLETGMRLASRAVYSLHKTSTRDHISKKVTSWGGKFQVLAQMRFDIPSMYSFHRKKSVDIEVDLIRVDVTNCQWQPQQLADAATAAEPAMQSE